jgi:uncharacterized protein involved in exopolysaccharide biosynthesis
VGALPGSIATGGAEPGPESSTQSGFREYAHVLWRRKMIIIIVVVLAVGGVLTYCKTATKSYTATATVYLEPSLSPLISPQSGGTSTGSVVNVQDIIQIIESNSISNLVARTVPNPPSVTATQVGTLATTDILQLSVSSSSPTEAAAAANAYANGYIAFEKNVLKTTYQNADNQVSNKVGTIQLAIANLTQQIQSTPAGVNVTTKEVQLSDLETQLTQLEDQQQQYEFYGSQGTSTEVGRVISAASVPTSASSPKTIEYTLLAFIFSLIAGIGLALLVNAVARRE